MRESTVVAEWKAEGRAEGRAEGITQGIAQGIAQGLTQGKRSALLLVLGQKFGAAVPADLAAAIEAQADIDVLSQWLAGAVAAESLDAFRAAITR
jgi:flagellar biosynthesis/type III secretory pathway protein FliH